MQQAFLAAQDGQQGPNLPNLDFSLKPGETVSLKPADKVNSMVCHLLAMLVVQTPQLAGDKEASCEKLTEAQSFRLALSLEPSCRHPHSLS